jgi:hypothetical protein
MNMNVQLGGVRESLLDFVEKTKTFQTVLVYIAIILLIVFKNQIPPVIYEQADSFLGRLLAVFLVALVTIQFDWILGLLTAVAIALLLGLPRRTSLQEGFGSGGETSIQVIPTNKKWFVERVLHENPIAIEEEKVLTSAIQNDAPSGPGGGVQNTSVT